MKTLASIFKVILVTTCIILNTAEKNYGQQPSYRFEHLQLPGGDLANAVNGIAEDSLGFMWFSTRNGLYRYDGYSFTNYNHDPADPTSLSATWVVTVYVDGEGTLWAGTYGGGLDRFNPEKETFTQFRNDPQNPASISRDSVTVIMEDHSGQLWVGTMGGLNRMDRKTGTFTRYMYDPDDSTSLSNDQVRAIFEDSEGTLWVGTNSPFGSERDNPGHGGLNRYNRETGTFTRYLHDPNDPNTLASNHVMSIFEDSGGTLWIGTWNNGLHTMDRESGTFTRHVYNPNAPDKLSPPFSALWPEGEGGVRFIHEDDQGAIWIGSFGHGVNLYDPETDNLIRFEPNPDDPSSLSSNGVWSMYQSRDGTSWISMLPGGLNKVYSTKNPFEHITLTQMGESNFIQALDADHSGNLTVGAWSMNPIISFRYSENENPSYQANTAFTTIEKVISAIRYTEDGALWIGRHEGSQTARQGGLYRIDEETEEIIPMLVGFTNTGIEIGPIVYIYEDSEGLLWLGTKWTGLFHMNRETGHVGHYTHNPENPGSLSHTNVTTIYETPSQPGVIWIGTEGSGLNRFDKETKTFTRFQHDPGNPGSLNGEYITSIYEEAPGRLLIGTRKSGLNWFDVESNTCTHFTAYNSGLSDNYVSCILGDKNGQIWIGTSQGLTRFDPESRSFYTFGPRHGVRAHPFVSSCDCDQAGNFIFGGINGFTVFNPYQIASVSSPSPVVLTNFILAGQPVLPEPDGTLQAPIWKSREIRLPHNESTFSFEFASLDYRDPQSNQYTYLLEGYDLDWRDAGTLRRAGYSRVPHGEYVFKVRAANSEGVWNMEGASIRVTLLPPWWQTWWAYVLYTLIIAAGIFTVDRSQRRRLITKERERARERELEQEKEHAREIEKAYKDLKATQAQLIQSEKMASLGELTAGIAHEIQNPLNFVNNFSEVNTELIDEADQEIDNGNISEVKTILKDIKENEQKINHHGKRADAIVKGMLQHSRTSSGVKEPTDINALADEYLRLAYHGLRAKDKSFNADFKTEFDESLPKINVIPQDIGRVLLNLINNAFYAVTAPPPSRSEFGTGSGGGIKNSQTNYKPTVTVSTSSIIPPSADGGPKGALISVRDNGSGIPPHIVDKIFQPFFTTKPTGQGTGLGLSLSYDIVKAHGGELSVKTDQNMGSEFIIYLPLEQVQ